MPWWHRLIVLGTALLVTLFVARLVDRRMARRDLPAGAVTRYRILRRSVISGIIFVGVLSSLLVIPQVRAVATGILASSAIVGIVVGFAAQRTIGNFIAGLLIAFTQPIRLRAYAEIGGLGGAAERETCRRGAGGGRPPGGPRRPAGGGVFRGPPPPPPSRGWRSRDDDFESVLRRTRRRRNTARNRRKRRLKLVLVALLIILVALAASGVGAVAKFRASCDLNKLRPVENGQNSFVFAADGSLLGSIPAEKNRTRVALKKISPWMRRATVAIEDHRFYTHGGVDYQGILRAAWKDLTAGHVVQGGSTITQQLVRNLYISKERTFKRKIKEACLAIKLSRRWSKDRILAEYMNQVYYGNHAYGIEAAAQTYFSEHAWQLSLPQAALLSGLPQAPSIYDPIHRPGAALDRRDEGVLARVTYSDLYPVRGPSALAHKLD